MDFNDFHGIFIRLYRGFFLSCPPPPVIHNFRYMVSVEHGNGKAIKRKLCIMEGPCSIDQNRFSLNNCTKRLTGICLSI